MLVLEVLCNLQLNVMHKYGSDMRQDMKELKMFKDLTVDNVIDKGRIEFHSKIVFAVTCSKCCKVCTT